MPIYEFTCDHCEEKFEELVPFGSNGNGLSCPSCKSFDIRKMMSAFGISGSALTKRSSGSSCSTCASSNCSHCH